MIASIQKIRVESQEHMAGRVKSMAYVGNVAVFIKYQMENIKPGYQVFNYIDKPDLNMNDLVAQVETSLNKKLPAVRLPYLLGFAGGITFDILAKLTV